MALDLKQVPNTPGIYKFFSKNKIKNGKNNEKKNIEDFVLYKTKIIKDEKKYFLSLSRFKIKKRLGNNKANKLSSKKILKPT